MKSQRVAHVVVGCFLLLLGLLGTVAVTWISRQLAGRPSDFVVWWWLRNGLPVAGTLALGIVFLRPSRLGWYLAIAVLAIHILRGATGLGNQLPGFFNLRGDVRELSQQAATGDVGARESLEGAQVVAGKMSFGVLASIAGIVLDLALVVWAARCRAYWVSGGKEMGMNIDGGSSPPRGSVSAPSAR